MGSESSQRLQHVAETAVARVVGDGRATAAAVVIGDRRRLLAEAYGGARLATSSGPVVADSLFDLASLSKPWTATLAVALDRTGELPLDRAVGATWPGMPAALAELPLSDLLRHRARLESWAPLYRDRPPAERALLELALRPPLGARRPTYSDLGYLLWGASALRATRRTSLYRLLRDRVLVPLGVEGIVERPNRRRAVACLLDTHREVELARRAGVRIAPLGPPPLGRPQDGHCRTLGGYLGQAGLFGTAESLWNLGRAWLEPRPPLTPARVRDALAGSGRWLLGWERRTRAGSSGPALSTEAFGHVGFTGGSLWIDPATERIVVFLAHRSALDVDLAPDRRRLHRLAQAGR